MKILVTTTSFQDTPGQHHDLIKSTGYNITYMRGPLSSEALSPHIAEFDGIICGDDHFTEQVIKKGCSGNLKIISKYGIGLDKIDLKAAKNYGLEIRNCKGVNHHAVAEHVFGLLLSFYKNIHTEYAFTKKGIWDRLIGHEIYKKKIGVIGLGQIGKEVVKRSKSFGLDVSAFDIKYDDDFINKYEVQKLNSINSVFQSCEIISLHINLNKGNREIISFDTFNNMHDNVPLIINTARSDLINMDALIHSLKNNLITGYLTDVLDIEPMPSNHPLISFPNVLITPHIGSRTYQSVQRQAIMSIENLTSFFNT